MRIKSFLALSAFAVLATSGVAASAEPVSTAIQIRGVVPTICRVEFSQPAVASANGVVALGSMGQLCNQIGGYRVIMQHPSGMGAATVTIDGETVALSAGNETVLVDVDHPAERTSTVSINLAGQALPGALSFRAEPKGATY